MFTTKYTVDYDAVYEKVCRRFIMVSSMSMHSVDYDTFITK